MSLDESSDQHNIRLERVQRSTQPVYADLTVPTVPDPDTIAVADVEDVDRLVAREAVERLANGVPKARDQSVQSRRDLEPVLNERRATCCLVLPLLEDVEEVIALRVADLADLKIDKSEVHGG